MRTPWTASSSLRAAELQLIDGVLFALMLR
jgi:hypothetical protein